tara:strand:- start:183 stop:560 length:378 start_codon:yes stop_codon:yes gene_type:complete
MTQQVISISPTGAISGLQYKPKQGVDLRAFGKAVITRASEILWDDNKQKWYVEFREGSASILNGVKLTEFMAELRVGQPVRLVRDGELDEAYRSPVAYFDEYDEAVKAEIAYLNWARSAGLLTEK